MPSFKRLVSQLTPVESFSRLAIEDGYEIVPKVHSTWKTAKRRILYVLESMDSIDIKNGELFHSLKIKNHEANAMIPTFTNVNQAAWGLLQEYFKEPKDFEASIAVVNFNAAKFYHKKGTDRLNAERACSKRVTQIIDRLKPTDVIIMGDAAASNLIGHQVDNFQYKRGWVHTCTFGETEAKVTTTLDLESLYNPGGATIDDDESDFDDVSGAADLLYFVARNLMNAFAGKHLHDLSHIKPKCTVVDTIEKFDVLFSRLVKTEEPIGFDLETENLESEHNTIYTAQFSFDETEGFLLPWRHPKTCFNEEELEYIEGKLRKFFATNKKVKEFVGTNLAFDTRVIRAKLKIPYLYHKVWDVTAGEVLLDENVGLMDRFKFDTGGGVREKTTMGNLRNLFCHYGNDYYYTASFSKEQRSTIGHVDILKDVPAQNYCVADTQSVLGIRRQQLARARRIKLSPGKTYEKFYYRHVSKQMSNTVLGISHNHQSGSHLDTDYLQFLMSKESPLLKVIQDVDAELKKSPNVIEANKRLLKEKNVQGSSLFGKTQFVFEPNKPDHKAMLFFTVMGLDPVSTTSTGKPAIDKLFLKTYSDNYPEVKLYEERGKAAKLLSTYVKGWYNQIVKSVDSALDHCLRPSFGFFNVVTGRLNSFKPSLQQVPSRGPSAKYIKRMFTAPLGYLQVKWDFSANEVRFWGLMANDPALAESFRAGQALRKELLVAVASTIEELVKQLKTKGDLHIQNVFRFFGKWIEKSDPLRDSIKQIIFGVLYGKSSATLARDLKKDKEYAQEIIDKMFEAFSKGKEFIDYCVDSVEEKQWLISNLGRRRNIWRVITEKPKFVADASRRAKNSPIQGIASEAGSTSGYLVLREIDKYMRQFGYDLENPKLWPHYQKPVHDANYYLQPYYLVIPSLLIKSHMATHGLAQYYEEEFGWKMNIEPEIELEVSASEDNSHKWDWQVIQQRTAKALEDSKSPDSSLGAVIEAAVDDQIKLNILPAKHRAKVLATIFAPLNDPEKRRYLIDNYPLLAVKDKEVERRLIKLAAKYKLPESNDAVNDKSYRKATKYA